MTMKLMPSKSLAPVIYAYCFKRLALLCPLGSILYLEGTLNEEVEIFLRAHVANRHSIIQKGTIWPRGAVFHLPVTEANIAELIRLSESVTLPEICTHLVVYKDDQILLSAYDIGAEEDLWLNQHLPPTALV